VPAPLGSRGEGKQLIFLDKKIKGTALAAKGIAKSEGRTDSTSLVVKATKEGKRAVSWNEIYYRCRGPVPAKKMKTQGSRRAIAGDKPALRSKVD